MLLLVTPVIVPPMLGLPVPALRLSMTRPPRRLPARARPVPMAVITSATDREWALAPGAAAQMYASTPLSRADLFEDRLDPLEVLLPLASDQA